MKLLALETSSERGSVALACGDNVTEGWIETPREQTNRILPLVRGLLADAGLELRDLDGIVFGRGPGSFTGLRVAAAVTQGLALAADLPVLGVSSLAALAYQAHRAHQASRALVCVDARMGEVFWGAFEMAGGLAEARAPERLTEPETVSWSGERPWAAVGGGFEAHAQSLAPLLNRADLRLTDLKPRAADLFDQARADLVAGRIMSPATAAPVYLRDEAAWRRD